MLDRERLEKGTVVVGQRRYERNNNEQFYMQDALIYANLIANTHFLSSCVRACMECVSRRERGSKQEKLAAHNCCLVVIVE